jgi:hypothetical protein
VSAQQGVLQPLPPLYADPVALTASLHGHWRLRAASGAAFAARIGSIPLAASDFAAASRSYPIVFTSGEAMPVALVGLEQSNLFVDGSRWAEGTYVPAYVRRYPFVMIEAGDRSSFALAVDAASDLIGKEQGSAEGTPLFEGEKPSPATLRALEFCRQFSQDHQLARAFCKALTEEGLLLERRADITLPNGRKLAVAGFQVVDPQRFAKLSEQKVVLWHRNGWLGLIHFHLASLERFSDLIARQARREGQAGK